MSNLSTTVSRLISVAGSIAPEPQDVQEAAAAVVGAIEESSEPELDKALSRLREPISNADLPGAAVAALCAGTMVQQGGDPHIALDAILARLPEALMLAQLYAEGCEAAGQCGDDEHPVEKYGEQITQDMPTNAAAYLAVKPLAIGAILMLTRSPVGRVKARQDYPDLADLAGDLAPFNEIAGDLEEILRKL